jgi:hypothetical protein
MKLAKSLLLGSAAGLVAVAGAQAADLPTKKAAPVEYVRICAVHGPGFFYIPGSDTCIRISGRARYEFVGGQSFSRGGGNTSQVALGRIALDARTQTDWGLLRAYMRFDIARRSGTFYFGSGTGARAGSNITNPSAASGFASFSGQDTAGNQLQTALGISAAFVQWGGLTAGRIQSFFDFYADNDTWFAITDSDTVTQALAYTYTFGSGFSATLSIEDPKIRQFYPIAGGAPVAAGGINTLGGLAAIPGALAAWNNVYPIAFNPTVAGFAPNAAVSYGQRESVPDVVGVLRVDQGWGSAQLSAAYHRTSTNGSTVGNLQFSQVGGVPTGLTVFNPTVPSVAGGFGSVTGNGWAVQGGVKVNMPYFAAGDTAYLQAAYGHGAGSYVDSGFPGGYSANVNSIQGTNFDVYDGVVGPLGRLQLTKSYSAMVSFEHYWTPTIRQGLFGGFWHVSYSQSIRTAAAVAQGVICQTCIGTAAITGPFGPTFYNPFSPFYNGGTQYNVGSNVIWSPIKDLDIGVEVMYARNQMQHAQYDNNEGIGRTTSTGSFWEYRLRIQRDF